jgi:vitamin B12 transporter
MSDNISNPAWALDSYKVKEFVVVDGVVNYDISKNFSVYLKTDNIFNKQYEEVRGYGTPPYSMYGGVKAKF